MSLPRDDSTAQLSEHARSVVDGARGLRVDAEALIDPPALSSIERHGRLRRRRDFMRTASFVAALVVTGSVATGLVAGHAPAGTTVPWPTEARPGLASYHWRLSPGAGAPHAHLALGSGWVGELTLQHDAGGGSVGLLVAEVDRVARTPCLLDGRGMVEVGDAPGDVAARVGTAPGLEARAPARHETAFGRFAERLRLRTTDGPECPSGKPGVLLGTPQGDVPAPRRGSSLDIWVVDVGGRAVVVMASSTPAADAEGRALLRSTLATLRLGLRGEVQGVISRPETHGE